MRVITIIGGGIAGLSLGIALRQRGVPVVIHEALTYPRHKVCGEFMVGAGRQCLESLGMLDILRDASSLNCVLWHIGGREPVRTLLPVPALGISRFRLDAALADRFRFLGGSLIDASRSPSPVGEGVVLAAGRRLDADSDWIGLKCHAKGIHLRADLELELGDGAYGGCSPVEDGWFNFCGLFPRSRSISSPRQSLFQQYCKKYGLTRLSALLQGAEINPASCVGVTGLSFQRASVDSFSFSIGDAGTMVAPFTGNGMSMAMETGLCAAQPLVEYARGACSWEYARLVFHSAVHPLHRRARRSHIFHPLICSGYGQNLLWLVASSRLLPFRFLYKLLH